MSFDQLKREAKNLYSALFKKEKIYVDTTTKIKKVKTNGQIYDTKKGFKIKSKTGGIIDSEQTSKINFNEIDEKDRYYERSVRKHVYNPPEESSINETGSSFIDQIRKKFNE